MEKNERIPAAGKLLSHFAYVKGNLREDRIIVPKSESNKKSSDTSKNLKVHIEGEIFFGY